MSSRENSLKEAKKLLSELKESGLPIIVEGRNDEKALRTLGITNPVLRVSEKPGPVQKKVAEDLRKETKAKSAIILTDPDREGAKLANLVAQTLEDFGMHPVMHFRKMTKLFGKSAVEQLANVCELVDEG
ncbi:MAG: toprim domain-containing protein [archaeon]